MIFKSKSYSSEDVKRLAILDGEFPIFNPCGHTTIDMSNIPNNERFGKIHTLSIKLHEDNFITLCVIQNNDGSFTNIDAKFHSKNEEQENSLIHFDKNGNSINDVVIENLKMFCLTSKKSK